MGTALVTRNEYKTYIGINGTEQDSSIDSLVSKISELVKNYCRRTFVDYVNEIKTEYFNGDIQRIYLQEYPVIQVLSVENSVDYGQNYTDLVEYTDYALDKETDSIVTLSSTLKFPYYINGYKVNYYGGYEVVPEDLKLAIFDLITYYLKNDAVIKNLRVPTTQVMQLEYGPNATNFPSHIARVLNLYKSSWD